MKKRDFIKVSGTVVAGSLVSPLLSCSTGKKDESQTEAESFTLPDLPYDYSALEPYIDARTMEIHHTKHHAGYVRKLNAALEDSLMAGLSIEEMMKRMTIKDTAIRNNGGGHFNHTLFWSIMSGNGGGEPQGELASAINAAFGSFDEFIQKFSSEAASVFGSGWAWLCLGGQNELFITSTPNQDNPMMEQLVKKNGHPIMGIDVWEHAYYLKYQNRRTEYISNFFNVINWEAVNDKYMAVK